MIWKRSIPVLALMLLLFGCSRSTEPDSSAPYKPHNPVPLDASVDQPVNDLLEWAGGDADGDPVTYDVYFGIAPAPPLVEDDCALTEYYPGLLDTFTTYYWKIVARDAHGVETAGSEWHFTTGNNPPFVPGDPFPPDSAVDQSIIQTVHWISGDPDGDALRSYVYFGTETAPPWVSTMDSSSYDPGALAYSTTYYWKVVVRDPHNNVVESPLWSFTTGDTLPILQNVKLSSDTEGDGVVLSWDQAFGIDGYQVITVAGDTFTLNDDEISYTDDAPLETGDYTVYTFRGSEMGSPVTVSSRPFISAFNSVLYVWSDPVEPAGFGWDPVVGNGTLYDCIDVNKDSVDFYLNDSTAVFDFTSGDEPPYLGNKSTGILDRGSINFYEAPAVGYAHSVNIQEHCYYALQVEGDYYAKVYVLSVASGLSATFSYEFQKIKHLRIF